MYFFISAELWPKDKLLAVKFVVVFKIYFINENNVQRNINSKQTAINNIFRKYLERLFCIFRQIGSISFADATIPLTPRQRYPVKLITNFFHLIYFLRPCVRKFISQANIARSIGFTSNGESKFVWHNDEKYIVTNCIFSLFEKWVHCVKKCIILHKNIRKVTKNNSYYCQWQYKPNLRVLIMGHHMTPLNSKIIQWRTGTIFTDNETGMLSILLHLNFVALIYSIPHC